MAFGGFGQTATQATAGGGLFGNLGSNTQTHTQTTGGGLFGQNTQQQQPAQQSSGLFGQNTQQQPQQQQSTGLFGQPAQQQQSTGLFGQATQQQPQQQSTGLFGQPAQQQQNTGLFGQQQTQQQQQQPPQQQPSMFGQTLGQQGQQQQNTQLGQTQWASQPQAGQAQPVTDQMKNILEQWMPQSQNCKFKSYFYNKVPAHMAPFAQPSANDDLQAWDIALSKKPAPGYIPTLCVGFSQLGERIKAQQQALAQYNQVMHSLNGTLEALMIKHDTSTSVRISEAKRKHEALKRRTLSLATKVQVLKNRGYAMDATEEALKVKLEELEKSVCDPQINSRAEEIWARMVQLREGSKVIEREMAKQANALTSGLSEEEARRAEKVLEDYATYLNHLKKELLAISKAFEEWQKEQGSTNAGRR